MSLKVRLLDEAAIIPRFVYFSVGFDLHCIESFFIEPQNRAVIRTGICLEFPDGCYGRVAGRSSLAASSGIIVGGGVIDPDYRGEIKVILFNLSSETFTATKGDRIAQVIVEKYYRCNSTLISNCSATTRGSQGFGSSGK
uniref:Deoxyuridine 5'-triphosphate nucleotidohydrolase n=1 Tax=Tetranychus urticae TaxID=32264 RepID=A0A158P5N9_TETUR